MEEIEGIFDEIEVLFNLFNFTTNRTKLPSGKVWCIIAFKDREFKENNSITVFFYSKKQCFDIFVDETATRHRQVAPDKLMTILAKLM